MAAVTTPFEGFVESRPAGFATMLLRVKTTQCPRGLFFTLVSSRLCPTG